MSLPPNRRLFLQIGIGSAALLAVSGGLLRHFQHGYAEQLSPSDIPLALSTKAFAIVKAIVRTLTPAGDGFPDGVELGIPQRIDEEFYVAPPAIRSALAAGLQLLEHATLVHGYSHRFTALAPDQQRTYLQTLSTGKQEALRQVVLAIKQVVHLFYYAHPSVWGHIGYDGPFVKEPVYPDSHVLYQDLLRKRRAS